MSAASSTSLKALRQVAYSSKSFQVPHVHVRGLSMTGPATYASPMLSKNPVKVAQKAAKSKIEELSMSVPSVTANQGARTINTSRAMQRPNDNSTIDFAFLPSFPTPADPNADPSMRVPLLHTTYGAPIAARANVETDVPVHRPIISTAASDTTHISSPSPMAEVHDHASSGTLMQEVHQAAVSVTEKVKEAAASSSGVANVGFAKKLWSGLVDDVFGAKKPASST